MSVFRRRGDSRPPPRMRGLLSGRADSHAGSAAIELHTEVFVGIDVARARNANAIADCRRGGEVRFRVEADASGGSVQRVIRRIAAKYARAHFCEGFRTPAHAHART